MHYRSNLAANIAQPTVGADIARAEIEEYCVEPGFETDRFFVGDHVEIRMGPLPWECDPKAFFTFATYMARPTRLPCPGSGCTEQFHFQEELVQHMKTCRNFLCSQCESKRVYANLTKYQEHQRRWCKGRNAQQRQLEESYEQKRRCLDFMKLNSCDECGQKFKSQTQLNKHNCKSKAA